LRAEEGMTLIELLIAMAVMSIGIAALVAGFSSGIVSIGHARTASTAGTLADQQMELNRQASFTSVPLPHPNPLVGPDGHTYWMEVDGVWTCAIGTHIGDPDLTSPPGSCPGPPASKPVKLITIEVRDGSPTAKLLFTESATFDSSTG
jgi:prepilin-type N-terminal cleavage/methylation domain-containing protein